jgi:hypothetical protein
MTGVRVSHSAQVPVKFGAHLGTKSSPEYTSRQHKEMSLSSNFLIKGVIMFFRSPIRTALFLLGLCGLIAWIVCCGGSGGAKSSSSGGPTPTPIPPGHSVSVSWPGVTNYNVYRSTTSGGPYARVGWRVNSSSFTDTSVQAGATYFYVVTAVTTTNVESVVSSEIKVTVPSP